MRRYIPTKCAAFLSNAKGGLLMPRWPRWTPAAQLSSRPFHAPRRAPLVTFASPPLSKRYQALAKCEESESLHHSPVDTASTAAYPSDVEYDIESSSKLLSIFAHDTDPSVLLSSLSHDSIYTAESLLHLVTKCPLNHQSTLLASELCRTSLHLLPINDALTIFVSLMRRLGHNNAFAAISPMVSLYLLRMEQAVREGELEPTKVQGMYAKFIGTLHRFGGKEDASGGKMDPLPDFVRAEIARTVKHLLNVLDALPSTSYARAVSLETKFMRKVMLDRFMSLELAEILVACAQRSGTELKPDQLQRCFIVAVSEGDDARANEFLAMKREATLQTNGSRYQGECQEHREVVNLARGSSNFEHLYTSLQPHLNDVPDPEPASTPDCVSSEPDLVKHRHSWSILIARAAKQPGIKSQDILDLYAHLPPSAVCGYTLTPIMKSLLDLDDLESAWKVWLEAVRLEKAAKEDGRYVDNVALGVATEICAKLYDYEAAVSLVDVHAQRVSSSRKHEAKRFKIDTQNVNMLLKLSAWFKAPAVAFRLWAASLPRWGVRLDGVSLGLLLYTARRVELGSGPDGCDADFDTRFQLLMNEFSFRRKDRDDIGDTFSGAYRAYDEDGFAKGDARVLLDPPGFKWYKAYGSTRPWQHARQIFREVVLDNWPFLKQVTSPLELESGMLGFASFFGGTLPHSDLPEHSTTLPIPTARYTHIIPAAPTWYAYVRLLGTFNRVEEIPLVLAWMKELKIRPNWQTMCEALAFVSEVEGPRRRVNAWTEDGNARLVRDEEILRRWLCEWMGYGTEVGKDGVRRLAVPSEEDVSDFRRGVMESGKKLIL